MSALGWDEELERRRIVRVTVEKYPGFLFGERRDRLTDRLNETISPSRFALFKQLERRARFNPFLRGESLMIEIEKLVPGDDPKDLARFDEFSIYVWLFCSSHYGRIRRSTRRWIKNKLNACEYYPEGRLYLRLLNDYKDNNTSPPSVHFEFLNSTVFGRDYFDE